MPGSPEQVCADSGDTQTGPTFSRSSLGAGKGIYAHMDSGDSPSSTRIDSVTIIAQPGIDIKRIQSQLLLGVGRNIMKAR